MAARTGGPATFEAPPNIALVKYWGVRDAELTLPNNSSLSVTLDRFRTRTTAEFDPALREDEFSLDGVRMAGTPRDDVVRFLDRVRVLAGRTDRAAVRSTNNFPTASGLASSASGFAALAGAASLAAGLRLAPRALSQLARLGSGSASRSVFGGFVEWRAGSRPDGRDCYADPIAGPDHWPELVDRVAIVRDAPTKSTRSAVAMQSSVRTSPEYAGRLREVPRRIARMKRAIREKDLETLFETTIEECDNFRTVCETTTPKLDYLTSTSRAILSEVRSANADAGRTVAAYTHDAGAHVHVFTRAGDLRKLRKRLDRVAGVERWLTVRPGPGGRPVGRRAS